MSVIWLRLVRWQPTGHARHLFPAFVSFRGRGHRNGHRHRSALERDDAALGRRPPRCRRCAVRGHAGADDLAGCGTWRGQNPAERVLAGLARVPPGVCLRRCAGLGRCGGAKLTVGEGGATDVTPCHTLGLYILVSSRASPGGCASFASVGVHHRSSQATGEHFDRSAGWRIGTCCSSNRAFGQTRSSPKLGILLGIAQLKHCAAVGSYSAGLKEAESCEFLC